VQKRTEFYRKINTIKQKAKEGGINRDFFPFFTVKRAFVFENFIDFKNVLVACA